MKWASLAAVLLAGLWRPGAAAAQPPAPVRMATDPSGDITIRVTELSRIRRFVPGADDQVSLRLTLSLESKRDLRGVSWQPLAAAADDTGASLIPQQATVGERVSTTSFSPLSSMLSGARPAMPWTYTLANAADRAVEIAQLKGMVALFIATGIQELRFALPLQGAEATAEQGALKATLRSVTQQGTRYSAQLYLSGAQAGSGTGMGGSVVFTGDGAASRTFAASYGRGAQFVLVGADGTERSPMSYSQMGGTGDTRDYRLDWFLTPGFTPQALVVRVPKGQQRVEVPFEFRSIPLP